MRATRKSAVRWAGASTVAMLLVATSAFAGGPLSNRDQNDTYAGAAQQQRQRARLGRVDLSSRYRDNQRVTVSGRVTSFNRERDGYRVELDRNDSYWIPASRFGSRVRDLRVGISIGLGGIFRGGAIGIDAVSWPDNAGYRNERGYVRGVVERVDYRRGVLTLRDDATRRVLDVDMGGTRGSRIDLSDTRRGDTVTLSGEWLRGNVFAAYSIDRVNTGRY